MNESVSGLEVIRDRIVQGAMLLDDADRAFLLDKIEESRWKTGPTYNRGIHILMDVIQCLVEASYASPNIRK
jgi:hypothetical protein